MCGGALPRRTSGGEAAMASHLSTSNCAIGRQPMSAINHQYRAVNKTRRVRTQKHSGLFDVGYSSESPERHSLAQPFLDRLGHQARHAFGVFDWTRSDRVDAYSISSPLDSEISRQRIDTGFRRGDVKLHRRAEIMKRRADVQYLTAMFFELCKRSAANIERSLQIDVDNSAETIRRQLFGFTQKVTGRAIDDNVDLSELL